MGQIMVFYSCMWVTIQFYPRKLWFFSNFIKCHGNILRSINYFFSTIFYAFQFLSFLLNLLNCMNLYSWSSKSAEKFILRCRCSGFHTPSKHDEAPSTRLDVVRHFQLDCFHAAALVQALAEAMIVLGGRWSRLMIVQILPPPATALATPHQDGVAS